MILIKFATFYRLLDCLRTSTLLKTSPPLGDSASALTPLCSNPVWSPNQLLLPLLLVIHLHQNLDPYLCPSRPHNRAKTFLPMQRNYPKAILSMYQYALISPKTNRKKTSSYVMMLPSLTQKSPLTIRVLFCGR